MNSSIVVEGHRGYCARYPENTLISYRAAMELGVDAVEFDVWLTSDKVPVLMHDGNCRRTCGVDRHLRDMTYAEVQTLEACYSEKFGDAFRWQGVGVPTLEQALELFSKECPNLKLGVEIKEYTEETVDLTVALLKKYGFFDTCWFYAFNARIIKYIKTKYNGRTMGYPDFLMQEFEPDSYNYYDEIGINMRVMRSEVFPIYAAKKLPMHMYCADNEIDVRYAIEHGAALITANEPVPLLTVLGRM
ncbi:MAG: glycerophosphodiester phosphodiesterase [Ruminococcaceae bacterium]|nr:glycerophosphodiester phosphodiesterase [Oscillospiraceae bacterium]